LVSRLSAAADDNVVDIGRVESVAIGDRAEHLAENMLRVEMRQRALALLADSPRRPHGVDYPDFTHLFHSLKNPACQSNAVAKAMPSGTGGQFVATNDT
jgi:hypothetical protein